MNIDEKDIHGYLKNAGYWLAQDIYKDTNNRISNIDDLIKKYSGRIFNYIHNNSKLEFILYLQKLYASVSIQPNKYLMEILKEEDNQKFQEYSLAFMMGFLSNKKRENE
jgi:hypothetical protein